MAEGVVDLLEAVQIEAEQGELLALPANLRQLLLEAFPEQDAVWQVRRRVVAGKMR